MLTSHGFDLCEKIFTLSVPVKAGPGHEYKKPHKHNNIVMHQVFSLLLTLLLMGEGAQRPKSDSKCNFTPGGVKFERGYFMTFPKYTQSK